MDTLMTQPATERLELHHVGIIVRDLDEAVRRYEQLGFDAPERFSIPEQQVEVATFRAGAGFIELVSPVVDEGGLIRFLESRGESVHHVAYLVSDIERELGRLADAGFELIDTTPRNGAHGWRVAFVHPKSCHGVLTELVQLPVEDGDSR